MKNILNLFFFLCILGACRNHPQISEEAKALFEKGQRLEKQNRPEQATKNYLDALSLLSSSQEKELIFNIYDKLIDLLLNNNLKDEALSTSQQALKHAYRLNDAAYIVKALRKTGKSYIFNDSIASAIMYLKKALPLAVQLKDSEEISSLHNTLSTSYRVLKKYDEALSHNIQALINTKDSLKIYRNYSTRAQIYLELCQYDSARHYSLIGIRSKNIYTKASCYYKLSEIAVKLNEEDALKYTNIYRALNDSIDRMILAEKVAKVKHAYQQKEIFKKIYTIVIALFAIILIVIFYIVYRHKQKEKLKNKLIAQQTEVMEKHIDTIKALNIRIEQITQQNLVKQSSSDPEKKNIISILNKIGDASSKSFMETSYYLETKDKLQIPLIKNDEKRVFLSTLKKYFKIYMELLSNYFPALTRDDHLFCCLMLLNFSVKECAELRNTSCASIYTQKNRIKEKMKNEPANKLIFDHIFSDKQGSKSKL